MIKATVFTAEQHSHADVLGLAVCTRPRRYHMLVAAVVGASLRTDSWFASARVATARG
jgi:hypothetical protein